MPKHIANYVGFSTVLEDENGNKGFWNLIDQFFFKRKEIAPLIATGGSITTPGNGFKYHEFTSPGTFSVQGGGSRDGLLLLVGGGGGGASGSPSGGGQAGGGAGGVIIAPISITPATIFSIVIGAGGAQGTGQGGPGGAAGSNSSAGPNWTALGGGGAARYPAEGGSPGGLYGGTAGSFTQADNPTIPADSRTFGFGNFGGSFGGPPNFGGGGGGGAGGAGQTGTGPGAPPTSGSGGEGISIQSYPELNSTPFFAPTTYYLAGGGGGAGRHAPTRPGGVGGGGPATHSGTGGSGTANTGSGGGGGSTAGGTGGSGRCIIVYGN